LSAAPAGRQAAVCSYSLNTVIFYYWQLALD